jgi:hypothetical protein
VTEIEQLVKCVIFLYQICHFQLLNLQNFEIDQNQFENCTMPRGVTN